MNYFKDDHFAMENGVQIISLDDKACVCSMEIAPRHINAAGNVMGGAIFTLADFAFAVATNNLHLPSVSQYSSINYLNAVKGSVLYAKTQIVKNGRTSSVIDVEISDDTGLLIARYSGIGAKLTR
ncbi:MAG: PaaI family thioesterase [Lachnospiraceae bacterium]|nr:PaaI family thioesterase [Lachnospiraceae bacterium]